MAEEFDIYSDSLSFTETNAETENQDSLNRDFLYGDELTENKTDDQTETNSPRGHLERNRTPTMDEPPEPHYPEVDGDMQYEQHTSDQTALYIGNLTWWTTDKELETLFSEFGRLKNIKFFEDKVNGKSKGYALVEYHNADSAFHAKDKLHQRFINGKQCIVNFVSSQSLKALNKGTTGNQRKQQTDKQQFKQFTKGRGKNKGMGGPPNFPNPSMPMGLMPGFGRGRGSFPPMMPIPDPRMLVSVAPHVNPAFFRKDEQQWREDHNREEPHREFRDEQRGEHREDNSFRDERYRKREREERPPTSYHREDHARDDHHRDDRKRHRH